MNKSVNAVKNKCRFSGGDLMRTMRNLLAKKAVVTVLAVGVSLAAVRTVRSLSLGLAAVR